MVAASRRPHPAASRGRVPVPGRGRFAALAASARRVTRQPGLDVLLITIDTLRADAVGRVRIDHGRHAAHRPPGPRRRRVPPGARAQRRHPASHANILSGRLPFQHGVRDNAGFRFPSDTPTLATLLKAAGYRTGAFVSAFTLDSRFGLDRGFDVYDDQLEGPAGPLALPERHGTDTVAAAQRWLAQGRRPSHLLLDPSLRPACSLPAA
jgi:arylsulfatase A-like enzyme